MDYIPEDLPEPIEPDVNVMVECVSETATHYNLDPLLIYGIIKVEGGKVGTLSKNKNGTYDMGIMQINTIHLDAINKKFSGIDWEEITYGTCANIMVGSWILNKEINSTDNFWEGVGNYHSRTKKYHDKYLKKLIKVYSELKKRFNRATT